MPNLQGPKECEWVESDLCSQIITTAKEFLELEEELNETEMQTEETKKRIKNILLDTAALHKSIPEENTKKREEIFWVFRALIDKTKTNTVNFLRDNTEEILKRSEKIKNHDLAA